MNKKIILFSMVLLFINIAYADNCCECPDKIIDICNSSLNVETLKSNYSNGETIEFYNNLTPKFNNFIIEYWIEYSNGEIIRNKRNTTNLNNKHYTPNIDKSSFIVIKNRLVNITCENNEIYGENTIFVDVPKDNKPTINLINYSNFNDTLILKIEVYTGHYNNFTLNVILDNLKNETMKLAYPYTSYDLEVKMSIIQNCSLKSEDHNMIIEGSDIKLNKKIGIINNCYEEQNYDVNNSDDDYNIYNQYPLAESNINESYSPITSYAIAEAGNNKFTMIGIYIGLGIIAFMVWFLLKNKNMLLKEKNGIHSKSDN